MVYCHHYSKLLLPVQSAVFKLKKNILPELA